MDSATCNLNINSICSSFWCMQLIEEKGKLIEATIEYIYIFIKSMCVYWHRLCDFVPKDFAYSASNGDKIKNSSRDNMKIDRFKTMGRVLQFDTQRNSRSELVANNQPNRIHGATVASLHSPTTIINLQSKENKIQLKWFEKPAIYSVYQISNFHHTIGERVRNSIVSVFFISFLFSKYTNLSSELIMNWTGNFLYALGAQQINEQNDQP